MQRSLRARFEDSSNHHALSGQFLVASFVSSTDGNLSYIGIVPLDTLTQCTSIQWQSFLPGEVELATLRRGQDHTNEVVMPSRSVWFQLFRRSQPPESEHPTGLHEIANLATFSLNRDHASI